MTALERAVRAACPHVPPSAAAELARQLADVAREFAAAPEPPHVTRAAARQEAERIADLAAELGRALDGAKLLEALGMIGRIVNGQAGLNPEGVRELRKSLSALRRDALAALAATGDDERAPQLTLPGRGDKPDAARRVAAAVLSTLHTRGAGITTTDSGPAVQCVAAAFGVAGIDADARHYVRRWVHLGK